MKDDSVGSIANDYINIDLNNAIVLVPIDLWVEALQMARTAKVPESGENAENIFKGMFTPYSSPYISALKHITWTGNIYDNGKLQKVHLLQYTGFDDIKGVKIYEGDIVFTQYNMMGIVQFGIDNNPTYAGWGIKEGKDFSWRSFSAAREVMGNIYEDPELYETIINSKVDYNKRMKSIGRSL